LQTVLGPDGWYHEVWVWRESPLAETNHDLSYARSRDLMHWETAAGKPLTLPLTLETPGTVVDPVPVKGGLLNGTQSVGFDAEGSVTISYIKYDEQGRTQLYFARWLAGAWKIEQASDWNYRWDFRGNGSLVFEVHVGALRASRGRLSIAVNHAVEGSGMWEVDPRTMRLKGRPRPDTTGELPEVNAATGAQRVDLFSPDLGGHTVAGAVYRLHWQTLPENRDMPRAGPAPVPSMLRLEVSADE
jgi:hypothetical protein